MSGGQTEFLKPSDKAICDVWSGSALFAIKLPNWDVGIGLIFLLDVSVHVS